MGRNGSQPPHKDFMKTCRTCGTEKPEDQYYYRKDSNTFRSECKDCTRQLVLYRKLGVCVTDYAEMLTRQQGKCAVCGCTLNSSRYTKFAVDHCHTTGKVRGLLCTQCNTALGLMKDSPRRLQSAINYLIRHGAEDIV